MISSAVIIPTEVPFTEMDIKRALLTYDKLHIPSPDDREFIPPNVHQNVVLRYFGIDAFDGIGGSFNGAHIRPLGKVDGYDDATQKLVEDSKELIQQGKLEVISAPEYLHSMTMAGIHLPPDTPNPIFTYMNYRNLAENSEFVDVISESLSQLNLNKIPDVNKLSPLGAEDLEHSVNGTYQRPKAKLSNITDPNEQQVLSRMCHARLGTFVKFVGYSGLKEFVPFTTDKGYEKLLSTLEHKYVGTLAQIESSKQAIILQKRIAALENLIFEEYIDQDALKSLSLSQVMKFRTREWGAAREAKSDLVQFVNQVARESDGKDAQSFQRGCRQKLDDYISQTNEYRNQLETARLKLALKAGFVGSATFAEQQLSLIDIIQKAPSLEILIVVGALGMIQLGQQTLDEIAGAIEAADKNSALKGHPAYAIHKKYSYVM